MLKEQLDELGFVSQEGIFTSEEADEIINALQQEELEQTFGLREFLLKYPNLRDKIFSDKLLNLVQEIAPDCKRSIKSIYFDKPPSANWIVNWHQDLTINVKEKKDIPGYKNWRSNAERTIVQPSLPLLQSIFTLRIHLDDCTRENGALRLIEKSHKQGVIDIKEWSENKQGKECICEVKKGGVLIMRPLTLHASRRTENNKNRRVIHLEFSSEELPEGLEWKEAVEL